MGRHPQVFIDKLSLPGKLNNELSYVFTNDPIDHKNGSITLFGLFLCTSARDLYHSAIKATVKHYLDFFHRTDFSVAESFENSLHDSGEFIFENAIQYTGEKVSQSIAAARESAGSDETFEIKNMHCILGALINDTLFLSVSGRALWAYYMHPVHRDNNFSHYTLVPIVSGSDAPDGSQRLFANIVSGKVGIKGGTIFLCNDAFLEYIDDDQLKQSLTTRPIETLLDSFHTSLSKVSSKKDFSAIVIQPNYTPSPHASKSGAARHQTASNRSMQSLISTERGTDSVMSPQIARSIASILRSFLFSLILPAIRLCIQTLRNVPWKSYTDGLARVLRTAPGHVRTLASRIRALKRDNSASPSPLSFSNAQSALAGMVQRLEPLPLVQRLAGYASRIPRAFVEQVRQIIVAHREKGLLAFRELPMASKGFLVLAIIFLLLFVQSVFVTASNKASAKRNAEYAQKLSAIDERIDAAEASILYNDEARASGLLAETEALLADFPPSMPDADSLRSSREQRIESIRMRISKVISIVNPSKLGDLSGQLPNARETTIAVLPGMIALVSPDGIYEFANGSAVRIDTQAKIPSASCATPLSDELLICSKEGDRLYALAAKEKTVRPVSFDRGEGQGVPAAIGTYNGNAYVLDASSGKVFRHSKAGDGFQKGSSWVRDGERLLAPAASLAIDGNIYVASANGSIIRYAAGRAEPLAIPALEPPLASIKKIVTLPETDLLFVLDGQSGRVIILEKKTLQLRGQLMSETFGALADIALTPDGKDILILSENGALYRVPADIK